MSGDVRRRVIVVSMDACAKRYCEVCVVMKRKTVTVRYEKTFGTHHGFLFERIINRNGWIHFCIHVTVFVLVSKCGYDSEERRVHVFHLFYTASGFPFDSKLRKHELGRNLLLFSRLVSQSSFVLYKKVGEILKVPTKIFVV